MLYFSPRENDAIEIGREAMRIEALCVVMNRKGKHSGSGTNKQHSGCADHLTVLPRRSDSYH